MRWAGVGERPTAAAWSGEAAAWPRDGEELRHMGLVEEPLAEGAAGGAG